MRWYKHATRAINMPLRNGWMSCECTVVREQACHINYDDIKTVAVTASHALPQIKILYWAWTLLNTCSPTRARGKVYRGLPHCKKTFVLFGRPTLLGFWIAPYWSCFRCRETWLGAVTSSCPGCTRSLVHLWVPPKVPLQPPTYLCVVHALTQDLLISTFACFCLITRA